MTGWTSDQVVRLTTPQEINVATRDSSGNLRSPRTIWIVSNENRVFIRSTNGRDSSWFRGALTALGGQIQAGDDAFDVTFTEATGSDAELADAGYEAKYGAIYPSIVRHLQEAGPRAATLEVHPG